MTTPEMRELLDFNEWANAKTFGAIGALDAGALTKDLGSSFPSVLLTAAHIVGAEWIWLERWTGAPPPSGFPEWVKFPELPDLAIRLSDVETRRAAYLSNLPDQLPPTIAFRLLNGTEDAQPLDVMVRHVVNHSTYHRGQIAAFMRQLGAVPPSTDLIAFARKDR
jgi:uncharacterized damage-inducible protein DinB